MVFRCIFSFHLSIATTTIINILPLVTTFWNSIIHEELQYKPSNEKFFYFSVKIKNTSCNNLLVLFCLQGVSKSSCLYGKRVISYLDVGGTKSWREGFAMLCACTDDEDIFISSFFYSDPASCISQGRRHHNR